MCVGGGGSGVELILLFSSLSCSRFEIPDGPCTSEMGRELHPSVTNGGIRPCIGKPELHNGNAFVITHTDERKLQTESRYRWCSEQR